MQREGGPLELLPLINALQDFYTQVLFQDDEDKEIHILDSIPIRRELFKLNYLTEKFNLNLRYEASDVMDFLLKAMHVWMYSISQGKAPMIPVSHNPRESLANLFALRCGDDQGVGTCFVNSTFHIQKYQTTICSCNESNEKPEENNLYSETFNAIYILQKVFTKVSRPCYINSYRRIIKKINYTSPT